MYLQKITNFQILSFSEYLEVVQKSLLITMIIDSNVDKEEMSIYKKLFPIYSDIHLNTIISNIKKEGDLFVTFENELKKVSFSSQQLLLSQIIIKMISSDNITDDNEMKLFQLLRRTYPQINHESLISKLFNTNLDNLIHELHQLNLIDFEQFLDILKTVCLITMIIDGNIDKEEINIYRVLFGDTNIFIHEHIEEIEEKGNLFRLFEDNIKLIGNLEQQTYLSLFVLKMIKSDSDLDNNEIKLFQLLRRTYTDVKFDFLLNLNIFEEIDLNLLIDEINIAYSKI